MPTSISGFARTFPITEGIHLELRGEAFNVTNTPNFAVPASNVSNTSFGHITSTFGSAADQRILRVSGKVNFFLR